MKLSQFSFDLDYRKNIAPYPAEYRDESRMLVLHRSTGDIEHRIFKDIINYFDEGDVFVFNDTKVFPARLKGNKEKTGAEIVVFLLRELNKDQRLWDVLVDPARKIRIGNKLYFGENDSLVAEVIDNTTSRGRTLRFLFDGPYDEFKSTLYSMGEIPVPEYVFVARQAQRERDGLPPVKPTGPYIYSEPFDVERFQTIYAAHEGGAFPDHLRGPRGSGGISGGWPAFQPRGLQAHGDKGHRRQVHNPAHGAGAFPQCGCGGSVQA